MAVYRVALVAGVGALIALLGAGLAFALSKEGRLPPPGLDYAAYVFAAAKGGREAEALEQLELAAAIDVESRARLLPSLVALARRQGKPEVERAALLRLTRVPALAADAHARLADLLLGAAGGGTDAEKLAEAERHADLALEAKPDSFSALIVSGRIARARGDTNRAFEIWDRAGQLSGPAAANDVHRRLYQLDPELAYDYLVHRLNNEGS